MNAYARLERLDLEKPKLQKNVYIVDEERIVDEQYRLRGNEELYQDIERLIEYVRKQRLKFLWMPIQNRWK